LRDSQGSLVTTALEIYAKWKERTLFSRYREVDDTQKREITIQSLEPKNSMNIG
jgi:hypothetical protein